MGFVLDAILREDLIGSRNDDSSINYETINSTGNSEEADSSKSEDGFMLTIDYANGVSTNMRFFIEASIDGNSFVEMTDTSITVTDASGTLVWDILASTANVVRIGWEVTAGTADIYGQYSAKRRH